MTADSIRTRLLATTMICSAFIAPAAAQTAAPAADQPAAPAAEGADDQLIVVTGTLIRNPNLVSATPVQVVSEDELNLRQVAVAEDLLRQLPGVVPNIGSAVNNGNGGASFVDLRGLGSNRNLVLLDGVRLAPTDTLGRFDLNNIPVALVQRVDTLTGGAASTYGADAVAGVVNFITKTDFSGVEIQGQNTITGRGDGHRVRFDVTVGTNTDDGRGNVVLSIGYQNWDAVTQGKRDFSSFAFNTNGTLGGSGLAPVPSVFGNINPLGLDNNPAAGVVTQGLRQVALTGTAFNQTGTVIPFNFNPFNLFQTPFERYNIYAAGRYEVADNVEVYTRGIFNRTTVQQVLAPSGAFGAPVRINLNNPFLTPALRNGFCQFDTNPGAGYTPLLDPAACAAAANPLLRPGDAAYREVNTQLRRRTIEVGPRIGTFTTSFFDYRLGVRGNITDTIQYDVFGAYGESERSAFQRGYTQDATIQQSLLGFQNVNDPSLPLASRVAAPGLTCLDPSLGCVPANFFAGGLAGGITPEQAAFLNTEARDVNLASLGQIRATFTGELPVASPFAGSNVNFAAGAEYRDYSADIVPDFITRNGLLGGGGGPTPPVSGGYDVYEGFGEVVIPLVEDRPFFKSLQIGGGVRYSSYSVKAAGAPGYDTLTWKAEGNWEPVEGFRVRGSYQFASRAPNIDELFSPVTVTLTNLNEDPCASLDEGGAPNGRGVPTGVLRDVCIAQGAPPGVIGAINDPAAGQANAISGGNLGIEPEDSDSWIVGAVIAPRQIPGLSITVDYFNIVVTRAITTPTPQDAIDACFAPGNLSTTNPACLAIRRSTLDGSLVGDDSVRGLPLLIDNLGRLETDGIDLSVSYTRDVGPVKFNYFFVGTWTNNSKFQATPTSVNRQCVGFFSINCSFTGSILPEYTFNQRFTFTWADIDLSLLHRFISPISREPGDPRQFEGVLPAGPIAGRRVNFNEIPAYHYFDLALRFNVTENVSLNLLVENLTDEEPPILSNSTGSTTFNSGNTFPSTYDALGRRFTAAARVRF